MKKKTIWCYLDEKNTAELPSKSRYYKEVKK